MIQEKIELLIEIMSDLKYNVDEIQSFTRLISRQGITEYRINKIKNFLLIVENNGKLLIETLDKFNKEVLE